MDNQKDTWQSRELGDNLDEGNLSGDINDNQPIVQQPNLNHPLNNADNGVITDAAILSEEFDRSRYVFKTTATQPGNE